jgi:hypothetical protein
MIYLFLFLMIFILIAIKSFSLFKNLFNFLIYFFIIIIIKKKNLKKISIQKTYKKKS